MLLKIGAQGIKYRAVDTLRAVLAAKAIHYAVDNGARIINWSGYVTTKDSVQLTLLRDTIEYADEHNVLLVLPAGNDGVNIDLDKNCLYPQCFDLDNLIRVAELDYNGNLFRYKIRKQIRGSNYGVKRVEIGAVAESISTFLMDGKSTYEANGGTSNAAPVVTGVAALVLSISPDLKVSELKKILLDTATPIYSLKGKIKSGGAVNAYKAVLRALKLK